MATRRGAFIVIEGTDGSGKGTQFELLRDRLTQAGYQVEAFDFPRYDQPSSHFVRQYLAGAYGTLEEVGPYTSSLFYALDRYEASVRIRKALDEGKIIISNRFTGSSMAHQGTKFDSAEERRGYFIWLDNLEFEMLHIPRPDISFILHVPADIAQGLALQREKDHEERKRDIHELDRKHQERAVAVYEDLAQLFPKDFQRIDCVRSEKLLDVEAIHAMLWEKVLPLLPQPAQLEIPMPAPAIELATAADASTNTIASGTQAAGTASASRVSPVETGNDAAPAVTDPDGNIYAFTPVLDPAIVAAVVASLGQGGGELSIRVLQEFAHAAERDNNVLRRTISYYGDESVRQLVNSHVVVSGASGLLANVIEEGRMATYVEPRVRHLRYEQKDSNGLYRYFLPADIGEETAISYRTHIDQIFNIYAALLPQLTAHMQQESGVPIQGRSREWQAAMEYEAREVLQAVLPLAAVTTVAIYASAQSFQAMFARLQASTLPEAQSTGVSIHEQLIQTIPAFLDDNATAETEAKAAYQQSVHTAVAQIATSHLPAAYASESEAVQLLHVWPRNELDLVADMLYEHSGLPLATIQHEIDTWPYSRKLDAFEAYVGVRQNRRIRPGRALEKAKYTWDIVSDYAVMHELKRHRIVDNPVSQLLTPRYGYEVPPVIEAAGLSDAFETCFDISLKLYSILQQAGHADAAQYATLRGHKQRWQVTYNAREAFHIHELHTTTNTNPRLRAFVEQLQAKLSDVHPLLAESMAFASSGNPL